VLFLPFLLFVGAVWHIVRLVSREPAQNEPTDNLVIGRRLLPREINGEFANYVDLTAEFQEPQAIRNAPNYVSFPILDGAAPDSRAMREVIDRLRPGRTFIHCAQGHGRTGLFALALMLRTGCVKTAAEGLERLRAVRPGVSLSAAQQRCIDEFAAQS
jgi:protein-tyrosine phosphatase